MKVDYLIIGQGIAGTLLSRCLIAAGKTVVVFDDNDPATASRVAGGIINPVTGKRLVTSWMINELLPFAKQTYTELEQELQLQIVKECEIVDFHANIEQARLFEERASAEPMYLHVNSVGDKWNDMFRFNYGAGVISPCLLIDILPMLIGWRKYLQRLDMLRAEWFDWNQCVVENGKVLYKDVVADKIICCEGAAGATNPYFQILPWARDKGEALIASIPGLPDTHVYKQGISIVPWRDGLFWIGAAHDWKFTDMKPTEAFRIGVEEQLDYWLKLPYQIVDHVVASRPANIDRKPFAGLHPKCNEVGIFNGMGGKGISQIPYFANEFSAYLTSGSALSPEVDIRRYLQLLERI